MQYYGTYGLAWEAPNKATKNFQPLCQIWCSAGPPLLHIFGRRTTINVTRCPRVTLMATNISAQTHPPHDLQKREQNNFRNHLRNRNKNCVLPLHCLAGASPTAISCQRSFCRALGSRRPAALLQTLSGSSSVQTSQTGHCSPPAAGICATYHRKPNRREIVHIL